MTREAFVALVERLRPFADANPAAYRWRVRLFGWLGYGFILLLLFGALGLVGALVLLIRVAGALALKVGWLLVVFAWRILKSLWVKFERPAGRELTRAEAPALYAAIDGITRRLDAPRFHHILLTDDFNAAVMQQPRLGVLGWPRNFLLVGLPLLQSLTPEQAEAVVAHELGHLRGGHGRFGAWIYRVNQTWDQVLMHLGGDNSWVAKFFRWYAPRFNAWSYGIRRPEEFEADAAAARAVSPRALADALCALRVRGAALGELHWSPLLAAVKTDAAPPADAYSRLLPVAKNGRLLRRARRGNPGRSPSRRNRRLRLAPQSCRPPRRARASGTRTRAAHHHSRRNTTRAAAPLTRRPPRRCLARRQSGALDGALYRVEPPTRAPRRPHRPPRPSPRPHPRRALGACRPHRRPYLGQCLAAALPGAFH